MQTRTITIAPAGGKWVVRAAGAVIGETDAALEVQEDGMQPVIYFPRDDIEMAFLDESDKRTEDPVKGTASFYSIVAKSGTIRDCVWSYEDPSEDAEKLKGYLAFYPGEKITVEQL
jgi:uncharacterized protein (DUF427 family)